MQNYKLDPANYYTAPGLSWDALFKHTGAELELLTDYEMHLFIERGIRGGISMASKRHAVANNPLTSGYDPEKPPNHIIYLNANNLYGWAMCKPMPVRNFTWSDKILGEDDIMRMGPQPFGAGKKKGAKRLVLPQSAKVVGRAGAQPGNGKTNADVAGQRKIRGALPQPPVVSL